MKRPTAILGRLFGRGKRREPPAPTTPPATRFRPRQTQRRRAYHGARPNVAAHQRFVLLLPQGFWNRGMSANGYTSSYSDGGPALREVDRAARRRQRQARKRQRRLAKARR